MTMPTVSAPISSRAISATMGAAPVPVPPPSPAVTKTMSASASASRISARDLLGGLAADLGVRAGAQTARQLLADVDGLVGIRHEKGLTVGVDGDELHAACTPASTMRFTALVPPPPTPTTLMTAKCSEPELFGIVFLHTCCAC